jgi:hypothetical protein
MKSHTSAGLVRYSVEALSPIIDEMGGRREPWLPGYRVIGLSGYRVIGLSGYRVKILDGNCIEASEHRIKELRGLAAGALPGKSLVVYDPTFAMAVDVFPCEDGHAQERALLGEVLSTVQAGDVWVADRNFCVRDFLCGIDEHQGFFVIREHQGLPWKASGPMRSAGRVSTGKLAEQRIRLTDAQGEEKPFRRIRLKLDQATRDGEQVIHILTNLPNPSLTPPYIIIRKNNELRFFESRYGTTRSMRVSFSDNRFLRFPRAVRDTESVINSLLSRLGTGGFSDV